MKPRIVSDQVSSDVNRQQIIKNPAPKITPPKKKIQKPQNTLNNQSSMTSSSEENNQSSASIPGLVGGIFKFLSGICKNAADKQMQEGKKSAAYYAARFFEYLFDTVSFLTSTISSWISNPAKIAEDFGKVIDFFKDLWSKLVDWWNGVTGKKPEPEKPQNDVVKETVHQPVEPDKPSLNTKPENSHRATHQQSQSQTQSQTQNMTATSTNASQSVVFQSAVSQSAVSQPAIPQPAASKNETPTNTNSMTLIYSAIGRPAPGNTAANKSNENYKDEKDEKNAELSQIKSPGNDVITNEIKTTPVENQNHANPVENHDIEEEKEVVASFRMR